MRSRNHFLFFSCLVMLEISAFCQVRLPKIISNGMVLQRNANVNVWGWAGAGEKVTVSLNEKVYNATTGNDGKWKVVLPPAKEGGPYTMNIDASNHLVLSDIYFGDVWICSGQSNMVLPMERVKERYGNDIATADYPLIRQFVVPLKYDFNSTQDDVSSGSWESSTPQNVMRFSAVAFFSSRGLCLKDIMFPLVLSTQRWVDPR